MTEPEAKDVARFFARVKMGRGPNACWTWIGERQSQKKRPYGLFSYQQDGKTKRVVAHKFAFHLAGGPSTFVLGALVLAGPLLGQEPAWAASFAATGPEPLRGAIGRTIDGVSVYSGNVCAGAPGLVLTPAQILIETHKRGLVIFDGKSLDALLVGVEGRSPAVILLDVAEGLSIGGAVVTNTDVIKMREPVRKKVSFGLAGFAGLAHWLHSKLTAKRIDPEKVRAFALPDRIELAEAQECWRGTLLGITHEPVTFEVRR